MTMQIIHKNNNYCIVFLVYSFIWSEPRWWYRWGVFTCRLKTYCPHLFSCMKCCRYVVVISYSPCLQWWIWWHQLVYIHVYKTCDSIFKHAKHSACLEGIYDASKGMVSQLKVCKPIMYIFFMINCWKLLRVYSIVKLSLNETQQHALLLISQSARWHWINTQHLIQLQKFNRNTYK